MVLRSRPTATETQVQISPGSMKLWFNSNRPIRVVPVRSKFTVARSLG